MKNLKKFALILFFVQMQLVVFAQIDNTSLENNFLSNQSNTRGVYFRMYNFNYMRNYEYFNKFADGLTYFGNTYNKLYRFTDPKILQ